MTIRSDYLESVETIRTAQDERLVAMAKSGQEAAFLELWRRHSKTLLSIVHRITKNSQDTEDAIQDTFIKAYLHLESFDGRSRFSTWLTRIAINAALMLLRKRRRHLEISTTMDHSHLEIGEWNVSDPSPNAEMVLLQKERMHHLDEAIRRLKPPLRDVIDIQLRNDSHNKATAAIAGLSIAATKSRLLRARGRIRKSLERNAMNLF